MTDIRRKIVVLCIDDEPDLLTELTEEIRALGFATKSASGAAQALAIIEETPPDVVLCDVVMPDTDGIALLKAVRARNLLPKTSIFIYLTGLSSRDDHLAGRLAGADDYIVKPIDIELLAAILNNYVATLDRLGIRRAADTPAIHFSRREREVLNELSKGLSASEIAGVLGISTNTVQQYTKDVYRKLSVRNRIAALQSAHNLGLIDL